MSYNYLSFEDIVPKYLHTQLQSSNMYTALNKANHYQEKIYIVLAKMKIMDSLVSAGLTNVHKTNKVDFGQTTGHPLCVCQGKVNWASNHFLSLDSSLDENR